MFYTFGTVTWLLGDHLGSTSLSVSESGGVLAEAKYTPLSPKGMLREGEQRTLAGDQPTDYGYTGQREESVLGLMYYVARWYDSGIGHFVQADTVVPGAGNPAAWNRYAYVMYNPVKFVDPSGHFSNDELEEMFADEDEDWRKFLETNFSEGLNDILYDDDVKLGDLLTFELGGESYSGVFVLDEDGNLALWNMDTKEVMGLSGEINPLAVYKNEGDGLFSLLRNESDQSQVEEIRYDSDWMFGAGEHVEKQKRIIGYDCGFWCRVGAAGAIAEMGGPAIIALIAGTTAEVTIPVFGLTMLAVDVLDNIEYEDYYVSKPYMETSAMTLANEMLYTNH